MAKFAYNNAKNASINHIPFKLNCGYHLCIFYKEDINSCSKSKSADKLSGNLKRLIIVYQKKFYYAKKLKNRAHKQDFKPWSYSSSNKIWLNSKYIKTKCNQKLKAKFLRPFRVLYPVRKQVYKLELSRK